MTEKVDIIIGLIPIEVKAITVESGITVKEAFTAAGFDIDLSKYSIGINDQEATASDIITERGSVLISKNIIGRALEYRPSTRLIAYYYGKRGVKKRREVMRNFLSSLTPYWEAAIIIEELDIKNRSTFEKHLDDFDHEDVTLLVLEPKDLAHPKVTPVALSCPTIIVSEFAGHPGSNNGKAVAEHVDQTKTAILEEVFSRKTQRKKSAYDEKRKHEQDERDWEVWSLTREVMGDFLNESQRKGLELPRSAEEAVFEMEQKHGVKISTRMLYERHRRLGKTKLFQGMADRNAAERNN